jgi:YbbR domain-containing protein
MALFSKKDNRGKRKEKPKKAKKVKPAKIKQNKKERQPAREKIRNNITFTKIRDGLLKLSNLAGAKFEEVFNNSRFSAIATLALAIIFVFSVHSIGGLALIKQGNATIRAKDVTAAYDREKYVVEGLPERVDVTLTGDDAAIQSTKSSNSLTVVADLSNLGAGDHYVNFFVENLPSNVKAYTSPNTAKVNIYTKEFRVFPISPELININAIGGVTLRDPVLVEQQVQLKGPAKDLDRVSFVRALIDGKTINTSLTDTNATKFEGIGALVVPYDDQGNRIDNITTDAGGVDYTINLEKSVGKPINDLIVDFVGNLPEGQAIKTLSLQTQTVTINGIETEIDKISSLVVQFDLKNVSSAGTVEGRVITPEGVSLTNIVPQKITANITFGPVEVRKEQVKQITRINSNDSRYDYAVVNNNEPITVEVLGTREQLALWDQMNQRTPLRLIVDVENLGDGEHQLGIIVEGPPLFRYKVSQPTVKIRITMKQ